VGDAAAATVVVANPDEDAREVVARVVEAGGLTAVRVASAAEVPDAVAAAGGGAGATGVIGVILDLGPANLQALEALRAGDGRTDDGRKDDGAGDGRTDDGRKDDGAGDGPRVVVLGTGPANGRLALRAGADGYLVRPFHARDLRATLADALARPDAERATWRTAAAECL
jgi:CheY-like chemotaxis protein